MSREHTPEDRYELVQEARELMEAATSGPNGPTEPSGSGADPVLASLAAHADFERTTSSTGAVGGWVARRTSQSFFEEQREFNRLTILALEDLTLRLDAIERRLGELDADRSSGSSRAE